MADAQHAQGGATGAGTGAGAGAGSSAVPSNPSELIINAESLYGHAYDTPGDDWVTPDGAMTASSPDTAYDAPETWAVDAGGIGHRGYGYHNPADGYDAPDDVDATVATLPTSAGSLYDAPDELVAEPVTATATSTPATGAGAASPRAAEAGVQASGAGPEARDWHGEFMDCLELPRHSVEQKLAATKRLHHLVRAAVLRLRTQHCISTHAQRPRGAAFPLCRWMPSLPPHHPALASLCQSAPFRTRPSPFNQWMSAGWLEVRSSSPTASSSRSSPLRHERCTVVRMLQ